VQHLLGRKSLGTTETHLAVTNDRLRETVSLADKGQQKKDNGSADEHAVKVSPIQGRGDSSQAVDGSIGTNRLPGKLSAFQMHTTRVRYCCARGL